MPRGSHTWHDRTVEPKADVVTNPRTGEEVQFVANTPERLTMLVTWPRPGRRAVEHVHPNMEETWEVLEGRAAFIVDGVQVDAAPGTVVVAPPGRRHLAWNPSDGPTRLRIEMRPSLRWEEFTRRFFAGDDPVQLLAEYADEITL